MLREFRPALVLLAALALITGLVYPLALTGVAGLIFPHQAQGSLVMKGGEVLGSALIGQAFDSERYFNGRPSATTGPDPADPSKPVASPYNASNSMGANLGPTSKALMDRVKEDVEKLRKEGTAVPIDLVTTSASGLDPHISPEAAYFQVPRVARARSMAEDQVRRIVDQHIEERTLGLLGEPRVNVLALNLALDATVVR
jgi:K+-transporting ATPase ATPase C chain